MSAAERYRKVLSVLLPAGALGMTIMLGSAGAEAAREVPAGTAATPLPGIGVAERLSALRDAVSEIGRAASSLPDEGDRLAWGNWANFGKPGWNNWNNPENEKTARYAEYRSTGPGANAARRVPWAKQLSAGEAKRYTVANVLGGRDGWNPALPAPRRR